MKNTKKIVQTLFIINSIQLAVGICIWAYMSKTVVDDGEYVVFLAMGLMLLSSMITLVGLYLALKSNDNRFEESIRDLEELNTTLRAQRHDYLNHIQVIYGLMELGEYGEAQKYLEPVFKDIMKAGRALKTSQPAVNALLQAKWKTAEDHGIEVYLEVRSDLGRLPMEAWNLCKVLANIIDNGIYALSSGQSVLMKRECLEEQTARDSRNVHTEKDCLEVQKNRDSRNASTEKDCLEMQENRDSRNVRTEQDCPEVQKNRDSRNASIEKDCPEVPPESREEKTWIPRLWIQITEEREKYYFSIANNGPMIPPDMQEKIFRQGITTKEGDGHGMGLFISEKIVREAGGRIDLQSTAERTVFYVILPKLQS